MQHFVFTGRIKNVSIFKIMNDEETVIRTNYNKD